jgi:hypothetical protein
VAEADVIGKWCGLPGEVLDLSPDHTFRMTDASVSFTSVLLYANGYVDDYRIKTEFGAVRPTSLAGTWRLTVLRHSASVPLRVGKIAKRDVDEGFGLGVVYDEGWHITYSTDVFSPEAERLMSRCGSSGSPTAGAR